MKTKETKTNWPRLTYKEAEDLIYGYAEINDGYYGEIERVGVAYDPQSQKTLFVSKYGYFTSNLPLAINKEESQWLADNHPTSATISKVNKIT